MADAISLTLSNGDSPSIVVSASNSVSTLVATPDSSVSLDVSPASNASVSINTVPTTQLSVSTLGSTVSTVSQLNNSLTVSTALQTPLKLNLRDLEDVSGDPTSQQVLVYDAGDNAFVFADQSGSGGDGSGSQNTDAAIEVTNTDGAFDTIFNTTYESNSSVTTILSQILNPYVTAKLNLSNIKYRDPAQSSDQSASSSASVEVGSNIAIKGLSFSTTDSDQIQENSIKLLKNNSEIGGYVGFEETGFNGYFSDISLSDINIEHNSPQTDTFKLTATDVGSAAIGATYPLSSGSISISWRYKVLLCTSPTLLVDGATSDFNSIISGSGASNNINDEVFTSSGSFNVVTTAGSDEEANYTYITYPKVLGVITAITYNNFPIEGDFTLVGEFNHTNVGGLTQAHYIYRTFQTQALEAGYTLEITTS